MRESFKENTQTIENPETIVNNPVYGEGVKESLLKNLPVEERLDIDSPSNKGKEKEKAEEKNSKISDLMDKIKGMFSANEEQILKKAENRLAGNPLLANGMIELEKSDPEKAKKWKIALGKFTYSKWDEQKQDYVDTGKYT